MAFELHFFFFFNSTARLVLDYKAIMTPPRHNLNVTLCLTFLLQYHHFVISRWVSLFSYCRLIFCSIYCRPISHSRASLAALSPRSFTWLSVYWHNETVCSLNRFLGSSTVFKSKLGVANEGLVTRCRPIKGQLLCQFLFFLLSHLPCSFCALGQIYCWTRKL